MASTAGVDKVENSEWIILVDLVDRLSGQFIKFCKNIAKVIKLFYINRII